MTTLSIYCWWRLCDTVASYKTKIWDFETGIYFRFFTKPIPINGQHQLWTLNLLPEGVRLRELRLLQIFRVLATLTVTNHKTSNNFDDIIFEIIAFLLLILITISNRKLFWEWADYNLSRKPQRFTLTACEFLESPLFLRFSSLSAILNIEAWIEELRTAALLKNCYQRM